MKRHTPRWLQGLSVFVALAASAWFTTAAIGQENPPPFEVENCVLVEEHNKALCDVVFPEPTTTTSTPTTTTTTAPTTTSTTIGSELVIPETLPYDTNNFQANESFQFMVSCIDTDTVVCDLNDSGRREIAVLDYIGHGMPYLYPENQPGMHGHGWWVAGDREHYRCGYAFMYDQHPNPFGMFTEPRPAEFIARATIVRPFGNSYGKLNDRFMDEGVRYYDGSPFLGGTNEIQDEDCQQTALDDFDYDNYVPAGPDQIRVGLFRSDGAISDIRDFTDVDVRVPGHFEFVSLEDGRVTIVFILGANNKVSHVFYYDVLNSGRIAVEVNGTLFE